MTFWHRSSFATEDGTGSAIKYLVAWLFQLPCRSHIYEFLHHSTHCDLLRWHKGQHHDTSLDYHWSYGDDFYERQNVVSIDAYMK